MSAGDERTIPRVCDYNRLPAPPQPTMAQELQRYAALKDQMRSSIEPALLAANDAAFTSALNGVMSGYGYDKKYHPAIVVEPELHTSGGLSISRLYQGLVSIFGWLRRRWLDRD